MIKHRHVKAGGRLKVLCSWNMFCKVTTMRHRIQPVFLTMNNESRMSDMSKHGSDVKKRVDEFWKDGYERHVLPLIKAREMLAASRKDRAKRVVSMLDD